MQKVVLKAEKRAEIGKGGARSLRRHGMMPAVLYAAGTSTPIKVLSKEVTKLMASGGGEHALIAIELSEDKKDHWALIKDYQLDPIRNELLHVDFIEISLEKKIKITTPIIITKEPMGIKKGGILQQLMRDIEIECLPTQIPEGIEVDVSPLDIGHSLHVSDLTVKEGIKIISDPKKVILTVTAPVVEEVAAPAEAVVAEPEVVKKGKVKEEEAAGEEKEEPKGQKEQKEKKE
ncbi:MAG: 50S ribosomal protein L25 [Thermodesulfovibrionia bacterium]|nr:50S ribosomal protein L25 [Thermodesulfovibrionia bacterium]